MNVVLDPRPFPEIGRTYTLTLFENDFSVSIPSVPSLCRTLRMHRKAIGLSVSPSPTSSVSLATSRVASPVLMAGVSRAIPLVSPLCLGGGVSGAVTHPTVTTEPSSSEHALSSNTTTNTISTHLTMSVKKENHSNDSTAPGSAPGHPSEHSTTLHAAGEEANHNNVTAHRPPALQSSPDTPHSTATSPQSPAGHATPDSSTALQVEAAVCDRAKAVCVRCEVCEVCEVSGPWVVGL